MASSSVGSGVPGPRRALATVGVGGGVWRLCWHPQAPGLLAAAVMHGGVRVLCVEPGAEGEPGGALGMSVVEEFTEHGSMAYGLSWCAPFPGDDGASALASASFYDCRLNVWQPRARAGDS